ncbi:hypothetical protein EYC84_008810 [Monilinia fructicola]|uniref:Uncharacterized protein n=1 Tax=Monilinia fructicola TaxID=38448 RepID=A0A5M9JE72_MONFR|nr:hypothetical protein EYC84_008810 [Monilinia fructicola]
MWFPNLSKITRGESRQENSGLAGTQGETSSRNVAQQVETEQQQIQSDLYMDSLRELAHIHPRKKIIADVRFSTFEFALVFNEPFKGHDIGPIQPVSSQCSTDFSLSIMIIPSMELELSPYSVAAAFIHFAFGSASSILIMVIWTRKFVWLGMEEQFGSFHLVLAITLLSFFICFFSSIVISLVDIATE